jgi:hypothetical protein
MARVLTTHLQQLHYQDGQVFCREHGSAGIVPMSQVDASVKHGFICQAQRTTMNNTPCGKFARWPSKKKMLEELDRSKSKRTPASCDTEHKD